MTDRYPSAEPTSADARVADLERQLADWHARLPAHTISPGLMAELDALEEALAVARHEAASETKCASTGQAGQTESS